jgi:hypothetical protein
MEDNILYTLKETTDDINVLKEIDILIKESKSKSEDVAGSSKNEINGLKYIMNKHKDVLCSLCLHGRVLYINVKIQKLVLKKENFKYIQILLNI